MRIAELSNENQSPPFSNPESLEKVDGNYPCGIYDPRSKARQ
jgi:hypothetical protein